MASRTPAATIFPVSVGGAPRSGAGSREVSSPRLMPTEVTPHVTPATPGPHRGSEEGVVRRGTGVAQELPEAGLLVRLADPPRGGGERGERTQEPAVRLVLPRHRAVALPAVATQQVEAA